MAVFIVFTMSGCDSQKPESTKDNISTNSIDEGLPRELSQLSISSSTSQDEFFCDKGHSEYMLKNIFGYLQAQKLCDVALIAGGSRLVHLLYLRSNSHQKVMNPMKIIYICPILIENTLGTSIKNPITL